MAIAEVTTMYRAVYWLEGKETDKHELYLTRQGNNKFVNNSVYHGVLCANVNEAIKQGKVTGECTEKVQGGVIIYQWYLYNVQANAKY
ncbi:hypothetical protein [Vibrio phage CKB-S2]|nr:hypothetical protein [Vibrio phage CKB-S2]